MKISSCISSTISHPLSSFFMRLFSDEKFFDFLSRLTTMYFFPTLFISSRAFLGSEKWWIAVRQRTTSKLPSGNGRLSAYPIMVSQSALERSFFEGSSIVLSQQNILLAEPVPPPTSSKEYDFF